MPPPRPGSAPPPGESGGWQRGGEPAPAGRELDPLDELSDRVRAAQEAAERIVAEARASAGRAASGRRPPRRGYATTSGAEDRRGAEAQAVAALMDLGRGLIPPELRHALADLVRELLLLLRALIDWYLERLELRRREPVQVEDIPIT